MNQLDPDFGKPKHFDIDLYLDVVRSISDTELANDMAQSVPAFYRDNETERMRAGVFNEPAQSFDMGHFIEAMVQLCNADDFEAAIRFTDRMIELKPCEALTKIKKWMWEKLISDEEYAFAEVEPDTQTLTDETWKTADCYRFHVVDNLVATYNAQGKAPHVIDFGPASYVLLNGLRKGMRNFTYRGVTFQPVKRKPYEWRDRAAFDQPVIFICCEVIEHLWKPDIIYQYSVKHAFEPDMIVLSTPKHTFAGGVDHRKSKYMGHLRTYTPSDLQSFGKKHWPLYAWAYIDAPQMVLVGLKEGVVVQK